MMILLDSNLLIHNLFKNLILVINWLLVIKYFNPTLHVELINTFWIIKLLIERLIFSFSKTKEMICVMEG